MTEPGEATVVPIALLLNGRTGYTVWAPPWVEDGEEWQAFLGASGRVWLFEELADLVATLRSRLDNDLTDHPAWPMLRTLPASQLTPDPEYLFDLDSVPALTEAEADPQVVQQVTAAVDLVERLAECCDNGTLLRLLEQPGFADLLGFEDEETEAAETEAEAGEAEPAEVDADRVETETAETEASAETGGARPERAATAAAAAAEEADEEETDEDDDAWAEIGDAIRTAWPGVLKKLDECVAWRSAADLPELAEDEAEQAPAALAAADEDAEDEADAAFWNGVGIMPVELVLPSGAGYTLRCYVDDAPRFLGTDMTVDIFRTRDALAAFCREEGSHDLADLDTWPEVRDAEELNVTPPGAERYDLVAVDAQLIGGPTVADVRLVRSAVDTLQDLAEYCQLAAAQAALSADSPLGAAIKDIFATSVGSSILQPAYWSGEGAAAQWRSVLEEVDSCLHWHD